MPEAAHREPALPTPVYSAQFSASQIAPRYVSSAAYQAQTRGPIADSPEYEHAALALSAAIALNN